LRLRAEATNEIDSRERQPLLADNWTLDGADNVDRAEFSLLNTPASMPSRVQVQRSAYGPEYGRSAGGQINVITRSGTNQLHGTAYEFFRNDALNANRYLNKHMPDPTQFLPAANAPLQRFRLDAGRPVYIPGHHNQEKNKTSLLFTRKRSGV